MRRSKKTASVGVAHTRTHSSESGWVGSGTVLTSWASPLRVLLPHPGRQPRREARHSLARSLLFLLCLDLGHLVFQTQPHCQCPA